MFPRSVCPKAHPLALKFGTGGVTGMNWKTCGGCRNRLGRDSRRHSCKECNLHLCDTCFHRPACPRGHPLERTIVSRPLLGQDIHEKSCSRCSVPLLVERSSCTLCDFHLCGGCCSILAGGKGASRPRRTRSASDFQDFDLTCKFNESCRRFACKAGHFCDQDNPAHFEEFVHPGDHNYRNGLVIFAAGECPSVESLWQLFQYFDVDASGHLSRDEFEDALRFMIELSMKFYPGDADQAWEDAVGKDGDGHLNFRQFAIWAHESLGLDFPIGLEISIDKCPCRFFHMTVDGERCSCTGFRKSTRSSLVFGNEGLLCQCGHKQSMHRSEVSPATVRQFFERASNEMWEEGRTGLVEIDDPVILDKLQELLVVTHKASGNWTRDRGCSIHGVGGRECSLSCAFKNQNPVPSGYTLLTAFRNQNDDLWQKYFLSRTSMSEECARPHAGAPHTEVPVETGSVSLDAELDCKNNEWFLFHGTTLEKAVRICKANFRVALAGGGATWKDPGRTTGEPLYGYGVYFSERITKADEYVAPIPDDMKGFEGDLYAVLLCRVFGGRANVVTTNEIMKDKLKSDVFDGPYHSVVGDRITKLRKPYREIVIYDKDQCFPEFLLVYSRSFEALGGTGRSTSCPTSCGSVESLDSFLCASLEADGVADVKLSDAGGESSEADREAHVWTDSLLGGCDTSDPTVSDVSPSEIGEGGTAGTGTLEALTHMVPCTSESSERGSAACGRFCLPGFFRFRRSLGISQHIEAAPLLSGLGALPPTSSGLAPPFDAWQETTGSDVADVGGAALTRIDWDEDNHEASLAFAADAADAALTGTSLPLEASDCVALEGTIVQADVFEWAAPGETTTTLVAPAPGPILPAEASDWMAPEGTVIQSDVSRLGAPGGTITTLADPAPGTILAAEASDWSAPEGTVARGDVSGRAAPGGTITTLADAAPGTILLAEASDGAAPEGTGAQADVFGWPAPGGTITILADAAPGTILPAEASDCMEPQGTFAQADVFGWAAPGGTKTTPADPAPGTILLAEASDRAAPEGTGAQAEVFGWPAPGGTITTLADAAPGTILPAEASDWTAPEGTFAQADVSAWAALGGTTTTPADPAPGETMSTPLPADIGSILPTEAYDCTAPEGTFAQADVSGWAAPGGTTTSLADPAPGTILPAEESDWTAPEGIVAQADVFGGAALGGTITTLVDPAPGAILPAEASDCTEPEGTVVQADVLEWAARGGTITTLVDPAPGASLRAGVSDWLAPEGTITPAGAFACAAPGGTLTTLLKDAPGGTIVTLFSKAGKAFISGVQVPGCFSGLFRRPKRLAP